MNKKLFKNLLKWQNYAHYLLLTLVIVIFSHVKGIHAFHSASYLPNMLFVGLYVTIFLADTAIHVIFSLLPEPYKWED